MPHVPPAMSICFHPHRIRQSTSCWTRSRPEPVSSARSLLRTRQRLRGAAAPWLRGRGYRFFSRDAGVCPRTSVDATFIEADAQDLPFDDAEFDVVVSNLGVCHVPDQPRALAQARRVLRPAGKFAMTVWCGPDTSPCFAAVYRAIKTHGHSDVSIPPGRIFISSRTGSGRQTLIGRGIFNISMYRLSIARGTSTRRKTCSRFMQRGQSAWRRCWPISRRKISRPSVRR